MKPVEFKGQNAVFGKSQPEYQPLPAHRAHDLCGTMTTCWAMTWRERIRVLWTGQIWQQSLTFHHPPQPQLLLTEKPTLHD